ncbi:MAG: S9 family peptidase [Bacteroidales bacterium]
MRTIILLILLNICAVFTYAQEKVTLDKWLKTDPVTVNSPLFAEKEDVDGNKYEMSDLLADLSINPDITAKKGESFNVLGNSNQWKEFSLPGDSVLLSSTEKNSFVLLSNYLTVNQWAEIEFSVSSNALLEVYIDGEKKHTKTVEDDKTEKFNVNLHTGKHKIIIKILATEGPVKFFSEASYKEEKYNNLTLKNSLSPQRSINIHDILDGKSIQSAKLSPSGKYLLTSYSDIQKGTGSSVTSTVLRDLEQNKDMIVFRNKDMKRVQWLPESDIISYTTETDDKTTLYTFDVKTGEEQEIIKGIENISSSQWSPDESYLMYSETKKADDPGDLKRIFGNEDRIPGFRDRSYLHLVDVKSGHSKRITAGNLSTYIHDFHPEGNKVVFSTSYPDYEEPPFSKQNLYEMEVNSFTIDTIWKDKQYSGRVQYSPDGKQLLVEGGPMLFGDVGVNVSKDKTPNNYDGQLYLYELNTGKVKSITKDFKPAVGSSKWLDNNNIYAVVNERDYINLYKYTPGKDKFEKIQTEVEVINDVDYANNKPVAVYRGTSITTPEKMYMLDLTNMESEMLDNPKEETFKNITLGETKEWNFKNKNDTTIYGRVYYPPEYDENKKYPVIVYYYGGTSPVERSFGGRYPKNTWTANGYIVYVLQPSGATGFGQEFSSLHVNGWGKEQVDDIIEGTKKFLDAHPSADKENVGAIGASYGGYTTMLLQTKTDIFKTAVSHAGISSITSYWGEGYWGYTYNAVAAHNIYPWDSKDLYVNRSPLYNADKFNNSILLLHGTDDTNVPVGESKQYYAALKILGKDAEMILVDDENHWIEDYDRRLKWHHTILSWFNKKLKGEPQQWENMYPDKNVK